MLPVPADLNVTLPPDNELVSNIPGVIRTLKGTINEMLAVLRELQAGNAVLPGSIVFNSEPTLPSHIPLTTRVALVKTPAAVPSGLSNYTGDDYELCYKSIWNAVNNTAFPGVAALPAAARTAFYMRDGNNAPAVKSANADTDWDAGRQIVIDLAGIIVGAAGTGNFAGFQTPATVYPQGEIRGTETQTLTVAQLPAHNHNNGGWNYVLQPPYPGSLTGNDTSGSGAEMAIGPADGKPLSPAGAGEAHNNMQPTFYINAHLKY